MLKLQDIKITIKDFFGRDRVPDVIDIDIPKEEMSKISAGKYVYDLCFKKMFESD